MSSKTLKKYHLKLINRDMNAISILTQLPTRKQSIDIYVDSVKDDILSGYIDAEASAIMLKAFEDIIKALRGDKDIKEYIQDAADRHTEKSFEYNGTTFTKSERPNYNFKDCEDPEWLSLSMDEMKIKGAKKVREEWLKTLKVPTPDPQTGEIINPPTVERTSIVSISLKK